MTFDDFVKLTSVIIPYYSAYTFHELEDDVRLFNVNMQNGQYQGISKESAIPVVPMKVKIKRLSWIDQRGPGTSPRGDVEIIFGEPNSFDAGTDATVATARLEAAVAAL
jgi:hypothetical protein